MCCLIVFFLYILLQLGTIVQYFMHWTDYVFILVSERLAFRIRSLWRPSPKVDPGAFSGQRQGWKTPRGPSGSALLLCM